MNPLLLLQLLVAAAEAVIEDCEDRGEMEEYGKESAEWELGRTIAEVKLALRHADAGEWLRKYPATKPGG